MVSEGRDSRSNKIVRIQKIKTKSAISIFDLLNLHNLV